MIEKELKQSLEVLKAKKLYRQFRILSPQSSTIAECEGQKKILFCSNDYLGLSQHPDVIEEARKALEEYGVGAGAARLISGTTNLHIRLEEAIARMKGKEKALVFSAGYLANLGVLSALAGEKDLIVMDKLCHASLIDAAKLSKAQIRVFPHKQYQKCRELLEKNKIFRRKLIVSDTVFSMDGDVADIGKLVEIKEQTNAVLILDDAHGTGVLGKTGKGALEDSGLEKKVDVITGTLSKAIGGLGGFAAASKEVIEVCINFARPFIFATALPAPICAAALKAIEIIQKDEQRREALWERIKLFSEAITVKERERFNPESPIFPILMGEEEKAITFSAALYEKGFLVPAIRYPTVSKGKARLRVTLSALHETGAIKELAAAIVKNKKSEN